MFSYTCENAFFIASPSSYRAATKRSPKKNHLLLGGGYRGISPLSAAIGALQAIAWDQVGGFSEYGGHVGLVHYPLSRGPPLHIYTRYTVLFFMGRGERYPMNMRSSHQRTIAIPAPLKTPPAPPIGHTTPPVTKDRHNELIIMQSTGSFAVRICPPQVKRFFSYSLYSFRVCTDLLAPHRVLTLVPATSRIRGLADPMSSTRAQPPPVIRAIGASHTAWM